MEPLGVIWCQVALSDKMKLNQLASGVIDNCLQYAFATE
jgi:hypothetical protein